jgi:hypothetical protein
MPAWFVDDQVQAQAATLGLEALLPGTIPTTGPGLKRWYDSHAHLFDTTCVSIIQQTGLQTAQELMAEINSGRISIDEAARRFSTDPTTGAKGGAFGCIKPGDRLWETVFEDINPLRIGTVTIFSGGQANQYTLVGPTRRIPNSFVVISATVSAEAQLINTQRASALALQIQRGSLVAVNPGIGTWEPTTLGGTITAPSLPPDSALANPSANKPAP